MQYHTKLPDTKQALSLACTLLTAQYLKDGGTITKCPTVWARGSK